MFYKSKTGSAESVDGTMFDDKDCDVKEAFDKMDKMSKKRGFDESVEVMVKLGVDPTKGDQMIRGTCILPCGTGKEVKVCVFADMQLHDDLLAAGADVLGSDEVLAEIATGKIVFDRILCTEEYLPRLKKFARILGPRGLMPNTKSGTLVKAAQIVSRVEESKQGLVEYKVNAESYVMSKLGLRSFGQEKLEENFEALLLSLVAKKPESVKGRYIVKGLVKTTMGPAVKVDL